MSRWSLALLLPLVGCHASTPTGVETMMSDDFTGERGAAWPAPTDGYVPMGAIAIDGTRILMGRDRALVAVPLRKGATLARADQTVLYTSSASEVWLVDRVGSCVVGSDGASTYGWILPSGGATVTPLSQAFPVLRDDAHGLFWGVPTQTQGPTTLKHLATDTTCDPGAATTLGSVDLTPQWLDADDKNLYASGVVYGPGGVNDAHQVTYAVPLAGGTATIVPTHGQRFPQAEGDFSFGTLVLHVASSTASLERVTGSDHTTLWTAGDHEQLAGRAEDADAFYFTTNSDTCVEMGSCAGKGPPGSTEPCCVRDHYESHLYRVAK